MKQIDRNIGEKTNYEAPKMQALGSFETLTQGGRRRRRHRHKKGCGHTFS